MSKTGVALKSLGIIGGVSWHSSAEYYNRINRKVSQELGPRHSARIVMTSLDFAELLSWQKDRTGIQLKNGLKDEALKLKAAGCDAFVIASHTLSYLGSEIEAATKMTHLSLYDAVFRKLKDLGAGRVGMTGTRYTMSDPEYRRLYENSGFEIVAPDEPHFTQVAKIVYEELVRGIFSPDSHTAFRECFEHLAVKNVDAIVLGCTEIGLLVEEREWRSQKFSNSLIPLIELIETHVDLCTEWILESAVHTENRKKTQRRGMCEGKVAGQEGFEPTTR